MLDSGRLWLSGGTVSPETRRVSARCRCPSGHAFDGEFYVAINTQTHPDAVDVIIFTGLQSCSCPECGAECAIAEPVTLHDPENGRFALYIPGMLSHLELHLRAVLLRRLANADGGEYPVYFGDFQSLVGRAALAAWQSRRRLLVDGAVDDAGQSTSTESGEIPEEDRPSILEAFADLADVDSRPPSFPPEPDSDEADDWLDDRALGMLSSTMEEDTQNPALPPSRFEADTNPPPRRSVAPEAKDVALNIEADRVILSHRVAAEIGHSYDPEHTELWVQLHDDEGFPVVALTLVAEPGATSSPRLHWIVDMTSRAHLEVLEHLRSDYRAEVVLHTTNMSEVKRFEVAGGRERNVERVLKRAERMMDYSREEYFPERATARLKRLTRPLGPELPAIWQDATGRAESFVGARSNLDRLVGWLSPDKQDELVFVRSLPLNRLDEVVARVLSDAIRFGVSLPEEMKERAIAFGLAVDREDLMLKLTESFNRMVRKGKGPPEELAAANWQELFDDCAREGVEPHKDNWEQADELLSRFDLLTSTGGKGDRDS